MIDNTKMQYKKNYNRSRFSFQSELYYNHLGCVWINFDKINFK